jgi:hypothetical protein
VNAITGHVVGHTASTLSDLVIANKYFSKEYAWQEEYLSNSPNYRAINEINSYLKLIKDKDPNFRLYPIFLRQFDNGNLVVMTNDRGPNGALKTPAEADYVCHVRHNWDSPETFRHCLSSRVDRMALFMQNIQNLVAGGGPGPQISAVTLTVTIKVMNNEIPAPELGSRISILDQNNAVLGALGSTTAWTIVNLAGNPTKMLRAVIPINNTITAIQLAALASLPSWRGCEFTPTYAKPIDLKPTQIGLELKIQRDAFAFPLAVDPGTGNLAFPPPSPGAAGVAPPAVADQPRWPAETFLYSSYAQLALVPPAVPKSWRASLSYWTNPKQPTPTENALPRWMKDIDPYLQELV